MKRKNIILIIYKRSFDWFRSCSAASCTVCALPESSRRFACTTFNNTSGTARSLTTKYFFFSVIFPFQSSCSCWVLNPFTVYIRHIVDTTCNQNNTYPSSGMSIYQGHVFPYEGYVIIPAHTLQGFFCRSKTGWNWSCVTAHLVRSTRWDYCCSAGLFDSAIHFRYALMNGSMSPSRTHPHYRSLHWFCGLLPSYMAA